MKEKLKKIINYFSKKELILMLIVFIITFINDYFIFKNEPPLTNYLYPFSTTKLFYLRYSILKIIIAIVIILLVLLIKQFYKLEKSKKRIVTVTFFFVFIINIIFLWFNRWGYFKGDVVHIFDFATKLEFVPWHSIYTSLFYMISLSFIPHPVGVSIFTIILLSIIISIVSYYLSKSKRKCFIFILIVFMLTIPNKSYSIWPFRTTFSAYFELMLVTLYIFYKPSNNKIKYILYILTAFVCTYRSENIFYAILPLTIIENKNIKNIIINYLTILIIMVAISLPQYYFSNKYYNKDYMQINTYSTLQYIYNSNSFNDISKKETKVIDTVIPIKYLRDYGYHSYFEINYNNTGTGTTTGLDSVKQKEFLNSVFKLFWKNKKLVLHHKINNFTSMAINKTYFDNYQTVDKRENYFFEKQYKYISDEYEKRYYPLNKNYTYKFLNFDMSFNIVVIIFLSMLTVSISLFKKNYKILLVQFLLLIKFVGIIFLAPNMSWFYFYYFYLIVPILFMYNLIYKRNTIV